LIAISSSSARIFPSLKAYTEKLELARKNDKELTAQNKRLNLVFRNGGIA
jgi:hypothetical protein